MLLSEYDIVYKAQKAIKGSILAEHLACQPLDDYQPIKFDFPDEEIMYLKAKDCEEPLINEGPDPNSKWGLVFDGAVNAYGKGIGAIIVTPQGIINISNHKLFSFSFSVQPLLILTFPLVPFSLWIVP
jgi:hypothetical protein